MSRESRMYGRCHALRWVAVAWVAAACGGESAEGEPTRDETAPIAPAAPTPGVPAGAAPVGASPQHMATAGGGAAAPVPPAAAPVPAASPAPDPPAPAADAPAPASVPIEPPDPSGCIDDVSPGDHTYTCDGVTYLVVVDEQCTRMACGLIVDIHGGTMAGAQMRDNTLLHELAPPRGFIVVHPSQTPASTGGSWTAAHHPLVAGFVLRAVEAFRVDRRRIHVTGFSQGGIMSWYFVCNHNDLIASAAPVAYTFGLLGMGPNGAQPGTAGCLAGDFAPEVDLLYMNGVTDAAVPIEGARVMIDAIVEARGMSGEHFIGGDGGYSHTGWSNPAGTVLEYIEHDYGGQAVLAGHCLPGGRDIPGAPNNFVLNATTCTTGDITLDWGELVLQWFIDHPRRGP